MKKVYVSPEAEILAFAKEDVITASGPFDWNTPTTDAMGDGNGDWEWSASTAPAIPAWAPTTGTGASGSLPIPPPC